MQTLNVYVAVHDFISKLNPRDSVICKTNKIPSVVGVNCSDGNECISVEHWVLKLTRIEIKSRFNRIRVSFCFSQQSLP